jgi:hypothetical protein
MDKMFTDTGFDVTRLVDIGLTKFIDTRIEAIRLTQKFGYFYEIFNSKREIIGYGIPK